MDEFTARRLARKRARERARRRRRMICCTAVALSLMAATGIAVALAGGSKELKTQNTESNTVIRTDETARPVITETALPTAFPAVSTTEPTGTEGDIIYGPGPQDDEWPEDYENEKIEQALIEQRYLSEEIPLDLDTQAILRGYCEQFGVPYSIVLGVIETESTFRPHAENGNCVGYMQINKINAEWLEEAVGVTDLEVPTQNLRSGVFILSDLYRKYEDWHKALTCYNYGETGAREKVFAYGYTSTSYSRLVLERAENWLEVIDD